MPPIILSVASTTTPHPADYRWIRFATWLNSLFYSYGTMSLLNKGSNHDEPKNERAQAVPGCGYATTLAGRILEVHGAFIQSRLHREGQETIRWSRETADGVMFRLTIMEDCRSLNALVEGIDLSEVP